MKTINNKFIPFKGFIALTFWPIIFVREENKDKFTLRARNHESIHGEQQKEMAVIFFYIFYSFEYLVRLIRCKFDSKKAYRLISFEQEAYEYEGKLGYISQRKRYAWISYLSK